MTVKQLNIMIHSDKSEDLSMMLYKKHKVTHCAVPYKLESNQNRQHTLTLSFTNFYTHTSSIRCWSKVKTKNTVECKPLR